MEYKHCTKKGDLIALENLTDNHLENIIAFIQRKAKEGMTKEFGFQDFEGEIFYDRDLIKGEAVLNRLNYKRYVNERTRRRNEIL